MLIIYFFIKWSIFTAQFATMKKIKTALLSYGMSGKVFHAPFLELHEGFELVGSWERSTKRIQLDYPNVKSYSSYEELLEDEIELVVINTPTASHYEYAKRALHAGKHLIVEKAFTTTVAEAEELKAIAENNNLKVAVFQNRRWDSDFKTVKNIFQQGILGDIVEAEFHFDRYNPALSPKLHKETINPGSGILKDLGPHLIDQALHLFGMPERVFADIRITRKESKVDDDIDILLFYPQFRVRLKSGFFVREAIPAYILHGEKGSFLKQRGDLQEDALKIGQKPNLTNWKSEKEGNEGLLHSEIKGEIIRKKVPTLLGNYYDYFEGVYQSISTNRVEPVTAQDGINTMRIIEACIESNLNKRTVDL